MIPTRYKSKLPRFLSYPAGAELFSHELVSVPQFEKLTLSFFYHSKAGAPKRTSEPFAVIRVNFIRSYPRLSMPNRFIEEGCYDEKWEIRVSPVPRELNHEVKGLLLDHGFARIREWLSAKREPTWLENGKSLLVSYAPLDNTLLFDE